RLEELLALKAALKANSGDSKGYYYMGNFWFASRQYPEALENWEKSRAIDDDFPIVLRNLALIYYNKLDRKQEAEKVLEKAFRIKPEPRILMELDQLYKKINKDVDERLKLLSENEELVNMRDDLYLELITLYNFKSDFKAGLKFLENRKFHPWEGGEGKVPAQFILGHLEIAKGLLLEQKFEEALHHINVV